MKDGLFRSETSGIDLVHAERICLLKEANFQIPFLQHIYLCKYNNQNEIELPEILWLKHLLFFEQ